MTEYYNDWEDDIEDPGEAAELWEEIKEDVLYYMYDEHGALTAVDNFQSSSGYTFEDFCECDHTSYTYNYVWCCRAIVWATEQYDKFKGED